MKLGVYLHGSSPFNPRETIDEYVLMAQHLEKNGAHSLWFADHLIRTPDPFQSSLFETWTLISGLVRETKEIEFGTMVSPVTFRNIGLFANMITTVDHLSEGRIIAGIGAGWYEKEHSMFDIKLGSVKYRMELLEEYVQSLLSLWQDNTVNVAGKHIRINNGYLKPKPIQKPHPRILIGGGGEKKTLRLVAEYAQMSNFGGDNKTIQHKLDVLEQHCTDIGRSVDEIVKTTNRAIILGKSSEEVENEITTYLNRFEEVGRTPPSRETIANNRLVGTFAEVGEQIDQLEELGIGLVNLTINTEQTEEYIVEFLKYYS